MEIEEGGAKILIADERHEDTLLLAKILADAGFEVVQAQGGGEVLNQTPGGGPDLIIIGMRMPELDGPQVCKKLKEAEETRFVPVLITTASPEFFEEKLRCIEAGADDILSKPINRLELIARAKSLIGKKRLNDELKESYLRAAELADTDELTNLNNRRSFLQDIEGEVLRGLRYHRPFSLLIVDIDHFKNYNDRNGHSQGNGLLVKVAELIKDCLRDADRAARYGGEEFSIILPETGKSGAMLVAERLHESVESYPFPGGEHQPIGRVTVSVGVSTHPDDGDNDVRLIAKADENLYRAKEEGRNRVMG